MKILFFGTNVFALPIIKALYDKIGAENLAVATRPAKPAGRGLRPQPNPILCFAQSHNLELLVIDNKGDWQKIKSRIKTYNPEFCVVAAFGMIIPDNILNLLPHRFINIHPSLLPKYRGPSPIESAILNREKNTGVSFIILNDKMDAGDIIWHKSVKINNQNSQQLQEEISRLAAQNVFSVLTNLIANKISPQPQNDVQATYTHIITKQDGEINASNSPTEIVNKIRAYTLWPGVIIRIDNSLIKIVSAHIFQNKLVIDQIQPANKKIMNSRDFANGYKHLLTKFPDYVMFSNDVKKKRNKQC